MATDLNQQLSASGVAQVIVVLKSPAPPPAAMAASAISGGVPLAAVVASAPHLGGMEAYFVNSEMSLNHALAMAEMSSVATMSRATTRASRGKTPPTVLHFPNLGLMLGTVNRDSLAALRKDDRVEKVTAAPQPRLIRPVRVAAARLQTQITWGIKFLDVPKLWAQGLTGKGVRVGHLDTGADGKHPALKKAIFSFAEFDSFGVQISPAPKPHDTDEHGTHTAATIAGRPVQGRSIGVAQGADLVSAIVIEGGNVIARILGGMDWAVSQNVRVLSLSLGIPFSPPLSDFNVILQILRARNVLPIVAVGNEGPGTSRPPGNHPEPISVGAIDQNQTVADFSSSQRFNRTVDPLVPDLVAPGVDIISAKPGGGFQSMDGSSMATPHIAGLAALLFEAVPGAPISDVENAIYSSCALAGIPPERGNRGFPNAVRALEALTGTPIARTPAKVMGGSKKGSSKSASKKRASRDTSKESSSKKSAKKKRQG
ncbi:MAG: hypothetical protein V7641_1223 [Blastocatellia bacterium]